MPRRRSGHRVAAKDEEASPGADEQEESEEDEEPPSKRRRRSATPGPPARSRGGDHRPVSRITHPLTRDKDSASVLQSRWTG